MAYRNLHGGEQIKEERQEVERGLSEVVVG